MKRIMFIIAALFVAVASQSQVVDTKRLQAFLDELKVLKGKHVECMSEHEGQVVLPPDIAVITMTDMAAYLKSVMLSDTTFRYQFVVTTDKIGYNLVKGILEKYYDGESEDIFGIQLMACKREDGEEQTLFLDANNTLMIRDDGDHVEILYGTFNIFRSLQNALRPLVEESDDEYVDVEMFGGMEFGVHVADMKKFPENPYYPAADGERILQLARRVYEENAQLLESRLAKAESEEQREEIAEMIAEFKDEQKEAIEELERELGELSRPSFIEIVNGSDEHYIAIPEVPAELKEKMQPYAANGVYDWINRYYSFRAGAKTGVTDIISCIITPRDVAREYVIRNFPRNKWFDDGFTAEYKEFAATEYQGGTPAVLYSFSQTQEGYSCMLGEFEHLFRLKPGEKVHGLEVTQQSERNGRRFVQLWGEGGILMCFLDSPADSYCHMSIIIGGVTGFEQAVNEYMFGGEKELAKRCNIIIDSDLRDNSYGIHFTTDEYFYAGKSHRNGVHIDFGYARKLTE